jgi:hypothetical protein
VATRKGAGITARKKKYVPSAKQRAEDARLKEKLDHLTDGDLREFDKVLARAFKPQPSQKNA